MTFGPDAAEDGVKLRRLDTETQGRILSRQQSEGEALGYDDFDPLEMDRHSQLQQLSRALFESVPWVRRAVVQREFPNRLKVTLSEHQAVAWWGSAGEDTLVNTQGEVFQANPDSLDNDALVELAGPDDQAPQVLALYRDLSSVFGRIDLDIKRLELTPRGSWRVRLSNHAQIELGRGEASELMARAAQFVATVGQVTTRYQRDIESADLRYPNGYAVRMKGVSTVDAATAAKVAARPAPKPAPKPTPTHR